jgi:transposase-like protein
MEAMMAARKKRKRYTPAQRSEILAAAQKQGLTAAQVQKKFGVTPVTYYSWRKKSGAAGRRGRRGPGRPAGAGVAGQVRTEVQSRVRAMLPGIVRQEVNTYLDSLFGKGARGRRSV